MLKKEKGITLVALVITIIILLILAGVTISTALGQNGLFQRAKYAGEKYKESEGQEQSALEGIAEEMDKISIDYNEYVGAYVMGYTPKTVTKESPCTIETVASGHSEDQNFTTEDMQWRIWDYDRTTKTIRLISDKPTSTLLYLGGTAGYNNGVWAINEICKKCYGSDNKGITVANLRRTDIQKVSTYDYKNYKHQSNKWEEVIGDEETEGNLIYFGSSKTYTSPQYPKMWKDYDSSWTYGYDGQKETGSDKECEMWEQENGKGTMTGEGTGDIRTIFKQSYYSHDYKDKRNEFINEIYYDLLFNNPDNVSSLNGGYWLAGRYVHLVDSACGFGIQYVYSNSDHRLVDGDELYRSGR